MRVLIVDDHPLFAHGLVFLLAELRVGMDSCICATLEAALAEAGPFDLVLLDLSLPDANGIDALARMQTAFDGVPIVILSAEERPAVIRCTIEHGAAGFIPKSSTSEVLVAALQLVLAGGCYLPAQLLSPPVPADAASASAEAGSVSTGEQTAAAMHLAIGSRQLEILLKAVRGKSNKAIARDMQLAEGTVKSHLSAAYRVLGVSNRTEAVFRVAELGLSDEPVGSAAPATTP